MMVVPLILPYFIAYLHQESKEEDWWGWVYVACIVGGSILNSIFTNHMMLLLNKSALRIMSGLQLLIYEKVLKVRS